MYRGSEPGSVMNEILFRPVGLEVHVVVSVCRADVLGMLARVSG